MADNTPTTPTSPIAPAMAMPVGATGSKYHWWYDSKQAGVSNSPPLNMTGRSPPTYSMLSQSPPAGGEFTGDITKRRESLKNLVHLCDFATP